MNKFKQSESIQDVTPYIIIHEIVVQNAKISMSCRLQQLGISPTTTDSMTKSRNGFKINFTCNRNFNKIIAF